MNKSKDHDTPHLSANEFEAQCIELLHDLSMSDDEDVSASARLLKKTMPVLLQFITEENARGTPVYSILTAAKNSSLNTIMTTIQGIGIAHQSVRIIEFLLSDHTARLRDMAKELQDEEEESKG